MKYREYSDAELRKAAFLMLIRHFGHSNTLRFLSLQKNDDTDYMTVRDRLFEGMSAREVFKSAEKFWMRDEMKEQRTEHV